MKSRKFLALTAAVSIAFIIVFNILINSVINSKHSARFVSAGRISQMISRYLSENNIYASQTDKVSDAVTSVSGKMDQFGLNSELPDELCFVSVCSESDMSDEYDSDTIICAVRDGNDELAGFAVFRFGNDVMTLVMIIINSAFIILLTGIAAYLIFIEKKILRPFNELSEYPEKLSLGYTNTVIPETKNRYFGKFVWSMNMLSDKMERDKRVISRLEHDRQTLITSLAHGVKTPVTNILLYAEAISTGLYSDGKVDPENAQTAEKITENAAKIQKLTSELLETASGAVSEDEFVIEAFYLEELAEMIRTEYSRKMKLIRVPFEVVCEDNIIIKSDKNAVMQMIIQITENALKYGNGKGINIKMERQDDSACISVKNKGELLPENEMPFIFNSFWRGSNSSSAEGNGIGMYVSRKNARSLGGNIYAQRHEDTGEMEFLIILEL